jgi:TRAP-type C4-dicarboxylate transport system substrate-binding protein
MKLCKTGVVAMVALGVVASGSAVAAEKRINAITSLQPTNVLAKAFLTKFVSVLNKSAKGIVNIKYVGGQEVVPPRKAAAALKRGQFDMLSSPTAYFLKAMVCLRQIKVLVFCAVMAVGNFCRKFMPRKLVLICSLGVRI